MVKVCVLMGGLSSEREVSFMSGKKIEAALKEKGYEVFGYDYQNVPDFLDFIKAEKIDVVFNALHGGEGEDGRISALLNLAKVPYTYSDHTACAIAMDKEKTKLFAKQCGIAVPGGYQIENPAELETLPYYPMVVKPVDEGSSFGIYIVKSKKEWQDVKTKLDPSWNWMIEEYIPGRELTTSVVFDEALTVTEIEPAVGFYDYKAKYTDGGSKHQIPADVPADIFEKCKAWSLQIHRALGCRQMSRSDFRYDPKTNTLAFLEVNTHSGMTDTSLVPEQYIHVTGKTYADLCDELIKDALK